MFLLTHESHFIVSICSNFSSIDGDELHPIEDKIFIDKLWQRYYGIMEVTNL
jgi:hypothetical protein